MERSYAEFLSSLFSDREFYDHTFKEHILGRGPELSLSITDRCLLNCRHCLTQATSAGASVPLSSLRGLDSRYFGCRSVALSCCGDPLAYQSGEHNLVNVIEAFHGKGVSNFPFLTGGVHGVLSARIINSLQTMAVTQGITFFPELSFHLYQPVDDSEAATIARRYFLRSVESLWELNPEITVHIRGDLTTKARNIIRALSVYMEVCQELGLVRPCDDCQSPCGGTSICFHEPASKRILRATAQTTQPFGCWAALPADIARLTESDQQQLLEKLESNLEQLMVIGQRRWIDLDMLGSFFAWTNGDVDISYSVAVLGRPRKIANIYEQDYETVISSWVDYVWDHFIVPNRPKMADLPDSPQKILFEF